MNYRNIKKFVSSSKNFKSMPFYPQASSDNVGTCSHKFPKENLKSIKFALQNITVPKEPAPKIAPDNYHDSAQQSRISQRISMIQRKQIGTKQSNLIMDHLQNLVSVNQPSLLNLSSKNLLRGRNRKIMCKRSICTSSSSSRSNSFIRKSNALLQKVMMSYSDPKTRPVSSHRGLYEESRRARDRRERKSSDEIVYFKESDSEPSYRPRESSDTLPFGDMDSVQSNVEESLDVALAIKNKLEDLSLRIKDDLMRIDGSLKQKLASIKQRAYEEEYEFPSREYDRKDQRQQRLYGNDLDLMPVERISPLEILNEHSKRLDLDPRNSIIVRSPHPAGASQHRSGDMFLTPNDGRDYRSQVSDVVNIKGDLMAVPNPQIQPRYARHSPIVTIETRNAVDAEGVYFAPKRARKSQWM